eukprot:TRINITY_DN8876_c0_g1_i4.p2 TRINITY_DN8876_c0_g1~~TRINITY_DN8876_c0_g1_i4.p2  ORF type:complete len:426 (+),score=96.39 TRINITY_DN8876_c0_g1_i4:3184-4461(+)
MSDSVSGGNAIPEEKLLSSYLELLPGIVWRIDIVGNEITFLNKYAASPEGEKVGAILQNIHLAHEVIVEEDREVFQHSHELILRRRSTVCSFRVRQENGPVKWFKLVSMPDPVLQTSSIGMLMDITASVNDILASADRPKLSTKLDMVDDPVLLVRFVDRSIYLANGAAKQLLGYDDKELASFSLQDLFRDNPDTDLYQVYEGLIFSDHWNGDLRVTDSMGRIHRCSARVQAIARNEENLLWIILSHRNDCGACKGVPVRGNETASAEFSSQAMRRCSSVRSLLNALLKAVPAGAPTSAVLLSRIFIKKNAVMVTGVGKPFENDPEDFAHPYEGSIAESIVRFGQSNHVVVQTSKSIKAIDWALFIPRGIRSYYAQPFFIDGVLEYVLIFCSTKPDSYDPDSSAPLLALHQEFLTNLERCLAKKR